VDLPLEPAKHEALRQITRSLEALRDLRWRYVEGPSGRGRASVGITNSTGCSSVWGSTYPYNPYPFPWVNHLFQDAPSIAIGIFEGQMRKMADSFIQVRRAEKLLAGDYDAERDEAFFEAFDWKQFDDAEFALCPPVLCIGGDGAMLDIGFQNLSRLLASGKPIRVMVLDTQVYSNTGGQASTGTFTGQAADMSPFGRVQPGKEEVRKELALLAIAHRGTYVLQSSQASASHLIAGVLRGLNSRRPAIFNIYTPCPVEHGLADEWAPHAAKLALESRAFPNLVFDPDAGESLADCLSLDGNPAVDERWPSYTLEHLDEAGEAQALELPVTIADWAATEGRFRKHFSLLEGEGEGELTPFHEFLELGRDEREERVPFILTLDDDRRLRRMRVSPSIVKLADDRQLFWAQLQELAGVRPAESVRDGIAAAQEEEYERREAALRADYEERLAELRASYPRMVARRIAENLLRGGNAELTVGELLQRAESAPRLQPIGTGAEGLGALGIEPPAGNGNGKGGAVGGDPAGGDPAPAPAASAAAGSTAPSAAPAPVAKSDASVAAGVAVAEADDELVMEPYIETERCTTCNECTDLNPRMFAYDENKQAYFKDARAGTFREMVLAAEKCPAELIHPGTPLNPKEKDLAKWVERARPFN